MDPSSSVQCLSDRGGVGNGSILTLDWTGLNVGNNSTMRGESSVRLAPHMQNIIYPSSFCKSKKIHEFVFEAFIVMALFGQTWADTKIL